MTASSFIKVNFGPGNGEFDARASFIIKLYNRAL
jgi:hypothetical protein